MEVVGGKKMTNHEKLAIIAGCEEPAEIESLKMLLSKICDDVERGIFKSNYDNYLSLYKSQIEWLNSGVAELVVYLELNRVVRNVECAKAKSRPTLTV